MDDAVATMVARIIDPDAFLWPSGSAKARDKAMDKATIILAALSPATGRAEGNDYEQAETKIFARRFGSAHAKPCRDPSVATCGRYECQFADSCQNPAGRIALSERQGGESV